jgi:hypothetical protein
MTYYLVSGFSIFVYSLGKYKVIQNVLYFVLLILLILLVGLRFEVGGDWKAYLEWQESVEGLSVYQSIALPSPVYTLINILSWKFGGIYFVNLMIATLSILGLHAFSKVSEHPKFVVISLLPFVIFILAMGFSRQALALSFILLVYNRNIYLFGLGSGLAILSHLSIIGMIPIYYMYQRNTHLVQHILFLTMVFIFLSILSDKLYLYYEYYVSSETYRSTGTLFRLLPIFLFAIFFVFRQVKMRKSNSTQLFDALVFCLSPLITLFVLSVSGYSTPVDRIFYYVLPLVTMYISRSDTIFKFNFKVYARSYFLVANYILFFAWTIIGAHAKYWLPYKNAIFN